MTKTKTQHYVPQSYLRRFAGDGNALFVFDKIQGKEFVSSVSNVACENYFYDIPEDLAGRAGVGIQAIEEFLAHVDMTYSVAVDRLLKAVDKGKMKRVIERDQKIEMAQFIALQMLRTREQRDLLAEQIERMSEAMLSLMPDYSPDRFRVAADRNWVAQFQMGFMLSPETLEPLKHVLCNHIWFVGINDTSSPFYTSDTPVVRRAHYHHPVRSYSGLASPGIEIALPLTPRHILVLCERMAFSRYEGLDCTPVTLDRKHVTYYNSLQVSQSYRQTYCPSNEFGLAKEICRSHPEICSVDRTRIEVVNAPGAPYAHFTVKP